MVKTISRMKVMKRAFALLLVCALVLSNVSTLAVTAASISYGTTDVEQGIWEPGEYTKITGLNDGYGDEVITGTITTATKSAEWSDYDNGKADITFTLAGEVADDQPTNADVIIALDASLSMLQYSANGTAYGDTTSISDTTSRWYAAMTAVDDMTNKLLNVYSGNNVSLITFRGKYIDNQNNKDNTNTSSDKMFYSRVTHYSIGFTTSYTQVKDVLEGVNQIDSDSKSNPTGLDGGTDYTSALAQAIAYANELGANSSSYERDLYVVFISDGAPDEKSGYDFSGSAQASILKSTYDAAIYSVSIGTAIDASALKAVAGNGGTYYETTGSDLSGVLEAIIGEMNVVAQEAVITDVIDDDFVLDTQELLTDGYEEDINKGVTTYTKGSVVITVLEDNTVELYVGDITEVAKEYVLPIKVAGDSTIMETDWLVNTNGEASLDYNALMVDSNGNIVTYDNEVVEFVSPQLDIDIAKVTIKYAYTDSKGDTIYLNKDVVEEYSVNPSGETITITDEYASELFDGQDGLYTFNDGQSDATFNFGNDGKDDEMQTGEVTFFVTKNSYDVTFDANGGTFTGGVEAMMVATGVDINSKWSSEWVPTEQPAKIGTDEFTYEFVGWSTDPNAQVPDISFPEAVTGDLTFYAVYSSTVNEYTVEFISEDESIAKYTEKYGTEFTTPSNPTKDADDAYVYTFAYWGDAHGNKVDVVNTMYEDATYYAVYTKEAKLIIVPDDDEEDDTEEETAAKLATAGYEDEYDAIAHAGVSTSELNVTAAEEVDSKTYHYEYSIDDGSTWTREIPEVTNVVDSKEILVKAVADKDGFVDSEPVVVQATVTKATITVTANDEEMIYNETVPTFTSQVDGIKESSDELKSTIIEELDIDYDKIDSPVVGSHDIVVDGEESLSNYEVEYNKGTLTVITSSDLELEIQLTGTAYNGTYDAEYHPVLLDKAVSVVNVEDGTEVVIEYSLDNTNWSEDIPEVINAGTYTVYIKAVATNENYETVTATATATAYVWAAEITVTADSNSIVYGTTTPVLGYETEGILLADKAAGVEVVDATVLVESGILAVGKYITTASEGTVENLDGTENKNYVIKYVSGELEVTPKTVTLTVDELTKTYGATDPTLTAEVTGLVNGDELEYTLSRVTGENVGKYEIVATVIENKNYTIVVENGILEITPADVTIIIENATKVYGENDPTFEATVNGLQYEDTLTYGLTREAGEDVGTYKISAGYIGNKNYTIVVENGILEITPAEVTITIADATKVYGVDDPDLSATVSGLIGEDKLVYELSREDGEDVGSYTITATYTADDNYDIKVEEGTFTITKASAVITIDNVSKTYGEDDLDLTATVSGLVGEDKLEYELSREDGEDVGSYAITATYTVDDNYDIKVEEGTFTIIKASAVITINNVSKTYGEDDPDLTATVSGLVGEDELEYELSRVEGEDVGNYKITATYTTDDNYDISVVEGLFTISEADIIITIDNLSKTYGEDDLELTATVSGLVGEDELEYELSRVEGEDVGNYKITATYTTDDNYVVEVVDGIFAITPATVTITVGDASKVYGEDDSDLTATVTGVVDGDELEYELSRDSGEDVGDYTITATYTADDNYYVKVADGTFTITPATVIITVGDASKVYGEDDSDLTAIVTGVVDGDELEYELSREDGEDVGDYTITATYTADNNYNVTVEDGTFAITPASVILTVKNTSKVYGEDDPTFTATSTGLIEGDELEYTLSRDSGEDVGEYVIAASVVLDNNYVIEVVNGTLTIKNGTLKPEIEVPEVPVDPEDPTNPDLAIFAENSGVYVGVYDAEAHNALYDVLVYDGNGELVDDAIITYTMDGVTTSTIPTVTEVGEYEVTITVTRDNYDTPEVIKVIAKVTPAELTVTAESYEITYGDSLPEEYETKVDGLQGLDSIAFEATSSATADSNVGTYDIVVTELTLDNYTVEYVDGTLTIKNGTLVPEIEEPEDPENPTEDEEDYVANAGAYEGVYDAEAHEAILGLIVNDGNDNSVEDVTITYTMDGVEYTEMPTVTNVGEYDITITVSKENYDDAEIEVTAIVSPAAVTITVGNAAKVLGDADPTFTAAVSGMMGTDELAYTVLRVTSEDAVGQQALTAEYVANDNYVVTVLNGIFIITAAPVVDDTEDDTPTTPVTPPTVVEDPVEDDTVEIEEDDVPLAEEVEDTVEIEEEEVPLAASIGTDSWALLNLILAILTVATSAVLLIGYFINRKAEEEEDDEAKQAAIDSEEDEEATRKNKGIMRTLSLIPSITAVVVFILTENMLNPMVIVDNWTIVMLLIAIVQAVVAFASRKKDVDENDEDSEEVYVS